MSRYIPVKTRKQVAERASHTCEYCRLPQRASFFVFQVEHVISIRHGGGNNSQNLAYSCPICNRNKGSDLGTLAGNPPVLTRFFNPRTDAWESNFSMDESGEILPITLIGFATIFALDLNNIESLIERKKLIQAGIIQTV